MKMNAIMENLCLKTQSKSPLKCILGIIAFRPSLKPGTHMHLVWVGIIFVSRELFMVSPHRAVLLVSELGRRSARQRPGHSPPVPASPVTSPRPSGSRRGRRERLVNASGADPLHAYGPIAPVVGRRGTARVLPSLLLFPAVSLSSAQAGPQPTG